MPFASHALQQALAAAPPRTQDSQEQAAVAIILRNEWKAQRRVVSLLVIERAEHESDRWSGDLAFPGGRRDPGDTTLLATAVREVQEELGLTLRSDWLLGELDWVSARAAGSGLTVAPFVFAAPDVGALKLKADEVADVHWVDMELLLRGDLDTQVALRRKGALLRLPGYRVGHKTLWGLSHAMLTTLLSHIRPLLPRPG